MLKPPDRSRPNQAAWARPTRPHRDFFGLCRLLIIDLFQQALEIDVGPPTYDPGSEKKAPRRCKLYIRDFAERGAMPQTRQVIGGNSIFNLGNAP